MEIILDDSNDSQRPVEDSSFYIDDDTDDEVFPPISELLPCPTEFPLEGQIVWSKFKKYYWPALIKKIYLKEKKASLWYLDSFSKSFKVSFKNLHRYKDPEFVMEVEKSMLACPFSLVYLHKRVMDAAEDFILRRNEGIKDDPAVFFAKSVPRRPLSGLIATNRLSKVSNKMSESLKNGINENSDEESASNSEDEEKMIKLKKELRAELALSDEDYCPEPKVNAIVECIRAGQVNNYLMDIASHTIPCVRQQTFQEYNSKGIVWQDNTFPINIKDDSKSLAIYDYLVSFYESIFEKEKSNMFKYITNVWMPEAMAEALKLVEGGWAPGSASSANGKFLKLKEENLSLEIEAPTEYTSKKEISIDGISSLKSDCTEKQLQIVLFKESWNLEDEYTCAFVNNESLSYDDFKTKEPRIVMSRCDESSSADDGKTKRIKIKKPNTDRQIKLIWVSTSGHVQKPHGRSGRKPQGRK